MQLPSRAIRPSPRYRAPGAPRSASQYFGQIGTGRFFHSLRYGRRKVSKISGRIFGNWRPEQKKGRGLIRTSVFFLSLV
jgi:hypothetical protein